MMGTWIAWAWQLVAPWVPYVLAAIAAYLLSRLLQKPKLQDATDSQELISEQQSTDESGKEVLVRRIVEADKLLGKTLLQKGGGLKAWKEGQHGAAYRIVAHNVSNADLEIYRIAALQTDIQFDLKVNSQRVAVDYPTSDAEPVPMRELGDVPYVSPEELALSDDEFFRRLSTQELTQMQYFETRVEEKLLYILLDISPSMRFEMKSRFERQIWARGVVINLLLQAVRGGAKYFLRYFDSGVRELVGIETPEDATRLMDFLLENWPSGSGTNIRAALLQAIDDIRTKGGRISRSELLLITDGITNPPQDFSDLKKLLGDDIRLHVVSIGTPRSDEPPEPPELHAAATSYRKIK